MKKLDAEPRLQGAGASVVEWAREVSQAVNALANAFTGDVLKIANGGTSASTPIAARAALGAQLEPGVVAYTSATTPPPGWLKRNGAAVSRTVYASLFAAIGTTYGVGDGSTTFNLPDDRGLVDRGWDDGRGYDPARVFGSEQGDAIRDHTHALSAFNSGAGGGGAPLSSNNTSPAGVQTTGSVSGGAGVTETRMRNRAYLPIIKY